MTANPKAHSAQRKRHVMAIALGTVAAVLVAIAGWQWMRPNAQTLMQRRAVEATSKALGVSCDDVILRARRFVSGPLADIIDTGAKGGDWAALGYTKFRPDIEKLRDDVSRCDALENMRVKNGMVKGNRFEPFARLFDALHVYTAPDGTRPPRAGLQPAGALEKLQSLHKELWR